MQLSRRLVLAWSLALSALVFTDAAALGQPAATETNYSLRVRTERPDALYRQGDEVLFQVILAQGKLPVSEATVDWLISKDGVPPTNQGTLRIVNGFGRAKTKLEEPGFLLCRATFKTPDGRTVTALGGAGVDPLQIKPGLPVPDDFDAFWSAQKKKLADVPINPRLTPVTPAKPGVQSFDLQADSVGAQVSGYYSKPADTKPRSLPAILLVHGAGVRSSDLGSTVTWASSLSDLGNVLFVAD